MGRDEEVLLTSLPEDYVTRRFNENAYGMAVADGMGETAGVGERASRLAVATLRGLVLHFGEWQVRVDAVVAQGIMERVERWFTQVSGVLIEASAEGVALRTSLTAAAIVGRDLIYAHVGHSRVYVFRDGELIQVTEDHTRPDRRQDATRLSLIVPASAAADRQHILTRTLGAGVRGPRIDIERLGLHDRDVVLVCSNGLTDVVSDTVIATMLSPDRPADDQCGALIDAVGAADGEDDATVLLARVVIRPT
jgi:serine/threonine protein phosphatase PrpC